MKRKLLCIFLMIAGAASLAGTLLLSGERLARLAGPDLLFRLRMREVEVSPVYTLIFLSIVTITGAAFYLSKELDKHGLSRRGVFFIWVFRAVILLAALGGLAVLITASFPVHPFYSLVFSFIAISITALMVAAWIDTGNPDEFAVSARGMVFLWVFRALSIAAILACLAFIVIMWLLTGEYSSDAFRNVLPLMDLAATGIGAAALSLKLYAPIAGRGKARAARCIPIAAALAITFALGFIYINYMPKYSIDDGLNIILSDKKFAQKDITGSYESLTKHDFESELFGDEHINLPEDNPYYTHLFSYQCDSYGYGAGALHIEKGFIRLDPATGEYEYSHMESQDKTYDSGDWPELWGNYMYDKKGRHDAVLNLYYREFWGLDATHPIILTIDGSGDWDAKLKDVMYPRDFPEDEAHAFLKSMGEETLKTKLLEQVNKLGQRYKGKTIDLFFFGINIGTYQNGEILLKTSI